jgi:hypothetical protein
MRCLPRTNSATGTSVAGAQNRAENGAESPLRRAEGRLSERKRALCAITLDLLAQYVQFTLNL